MKAKIFAAAAFACLLSLVSTPSQAALIQWNLQDVHQISDPSVTFTGYFRYDTVGNAGSTGTISDFSVTALQSSLPIFTWTSGNSEGAYLPFYSGFFSLSTLSLPQFFLSFTGNHPFDGSFSSIVLNGFDSSCSTSYFINGNSCGDAKGLAGTLAITENAVATPLPAALPLYGVGLLGLVGLKRYRRRASGNA